MNKNKQKYGGSYKAKQNYLLSGLVFCGECGSAFVGNVKYSGRNKYKYSTYRCGNRDRTKTCSNKEIRKEYIEEYIMYQLEKKIFNDVALKELVKKMNDLRSSSRQNQSDMIRDLTKNLANVEKQMNNIVNAIKQGYANQILIDELTKLEEQKFKMEICIQEEKQKN